jgi:hypothetical protein
MSEQGTAAPAAAQETPAPAPQAQPQAAVTPATEADPAWLPGRLERAQEAGKKAILAELGIEDPEKAKAFIKAGQEAEDQKKSLADKLAEQATEAEKLRGREARLSGIVSAQAQAQMSALSDEQRAAVKAIAGDDPGEQLRAVTALAPTWKVQSAQPVAPATTSPPPAAPPGTSAGSPPDHKAVHQRLLETNPIAAARYAEANPSVFS